MLRRHALAAAAAALACCSLLIALSAGGAEASAQGDRGTYSCSYRAVKVVQAGTRLNANGRLRCVGSGVRRQVLRVCLLQAAGSNYRLVKCVTRAKSGPGLFAASASRKCGSGPETGFITRVQIRVRLDGGMVQTARTESSDTQYSRNCGS